MKKVIACSMVVAALMFSGCSDSVKSVEEYEKLSTEELDSMFKECMELDNRIKRANTPEEAEFLKEFKATVDEMSKAGIQLDEIGAITDEQLSKLKSKYAPEFVKCGRLAIVARKNGRI